MKRLLLALGAALALLLAVAWSGPTKPARPELDFKSEGKNPVTNLKLNNAPDSFQFAIVSDRTGGHRARVFSQAVEQLNLMQPEFVVSVGDLIEGYTADKERIANEWREFQGYVSRLQMPFFYVAGNHDFTNKAMAQAWKDKFGRSYYDFTYRGRVVPHPQLRGRSRQEDGDHRQGAARLAGEDPGRQQGRPLDPGLPAQADVDPARCRNQRLGRRREAAQGTRLHRVRRPCPPLPEVRAPGDEPLHARHHGRRQPAAGRGGGASSTMSSG